LGEWHIYRPPVVLAQTDWLNVAGLEWFVAVTRPTVRAIDQVRGGVHLQIPGHLILDFVV